MAKRGMGVNQTFAFIRVTFFGHVTFWIYVNSLISDKDRAGFASTGNVMTARIDVIEPIGSEELLYVSAGKHTFVAEIQEISGGASEKRALVEKEIELAFNMDKLHLFDSETENAILNP
jgi:multiple sugar transport system ATP-binding protein